MMKRLPLCLVMTTLAAGGLATSASARCEDYVPQAKPQNVSRDIVGQDLDTIIERGFIEFAVFEDFAPYSFEEAGQPRGVDIEIAKLIAESIGVAPKFKFVQADENLEADLRNWIWKGPVVGGAVANVMMHVPYNSDFACRVEQVVFTGQYYKEGIAIAYDAAFYEGDKPTPPFFRFDPVAVQNDMIADFYLTNLLGAGASANVHRFPEIGKAVAAIGTGEVRGAMGPKAQLEYFAGDGVEVHQPPLVNFGVGQWTVGVAVHFSYRPLGYAVDDAIYAALQDGRIEQIFADYGLTFTAPER